MLQGISVLRHALVATGIVGTSALGALGIVGAGDQGLLRGEHFDAKQVTVAPLGGGEPNGVRIREVVDIDFGVNERRGYQRIVPNDFGNPIDVTASSPDADATVNVVDIGGETRIRVGDPLVTFTGQRRYVLEYTLPSARLQTGELALDIIGTDETFETDRFTVEIVGFDLSDTACDVGRFGDFGGCTLSAENGALRTVITDLAPGNGITVSGHIDRIGTGSGATMPAIEAPPERNPTGLQPVGLVQLGVGTLVAGGIFAWFRRRGSNVVFGGGGAADAAYGELPTPGLGDPVADVPTYRVPDNRLAELATVEFAPPRGVEPWQGNVLLRERVDDDTVSAWFSEMVARGAIEITGQGSDLVLRPGQTTARLSAVDRGHLAKLFARAPAVELGKYDKDFTSVWKGISAEQQRFVRDTEWWERPLGGGVGLGGVNPGRAIVWIVMGLFFLSFSGMATFIALLFGAFSGWFGALLLSLTVAAVLAAFAYWKMLAARTAVGSALTLRTESFRRFLDASEGRHVEWAWENGLVREYSAWAVALGAADAWSQAIESSNIADPQQFTSPLLIHTYGSTFTTSRTAPSSSGSSGGGGGFGGGGVGGGGGGGSSGSW